MDVSSDQQLPEPAGAPQAGDIDLHVCPECSSHLVYPLEWAPVDNCHWRVDLRCPECESVSYTHLTLPTNREV